MVGNIGSQWERRKTLPPINTDCTDQDRVFTTEKSKTFEPQRGRAATKIKAFQNPYDVVRENISVREGTP
jgi:hypothetical protein